MKGSKCNKTLGSVHSEHRPTMTSTLLFKEDSNEKRTQSCTQDHYWSMQVEYNPDWSLTTAHLLDLMNKNQLSHSSPADVQKREPSRYASLKLFITNNSFFIIIDINLSTVSSFKIIFLKWSSYTLIWQYSTKICTLEQRNLASDYQTWS